MDRLELKIPPVIVFGLSVAGMGLIASVTDKMGLNNTVRIGISLGLFLSGLGMGLSGIAAFIRAGTSFSPTKPSKASHLVQTGIYRFTRNPMYLGLSFALLAWACYLDNLVSIIILPCFVLYMARFQIKPEERRLKALFDSDYEIYKQSVRRWL